MVTNSSPLSICSRRSAKTLYNLSGEPAPFDRDVPFKVVPNAFVLARRLKVSDTEIVRIIMS